MDLLGALSALGGVGSDHVGPDLVEELGLVAELGGVSHGDAPGIMNHVESVGGHLDWHTGEGDDGGHGGGEALDLDLYVAATLECVEDGVAVEDFSTWGMDLEDDAVGSGDGLEVGDELLGADAIHADLVENGDFGFADRGLRSKGIPVTHVIGWGCQKERRCGFYRRGDRGGGRCLGRCGSRGR